jgi:dephospho-CoA kinase
MEKHPFIVGLVGESGSGKDTVAYHLRDVYGAILLRFSDPIKDILRMFFERPSREDQSWVAVQFKKQFGKDIFCRALDRKIAFIENITSLNGLRYPEDYDYLRGFEKNVLIYITANQKLRWQRTVGRGEKSDDIASFEKFIEMESTLETEKNIPEIGKKADFIIHNEGTLEELMQKTEEIMRTIKTGK